MEQEKTHNEAEQDFIINDVFPDTGRRTECAGGPECGTTGREESTAESIEWTVDNAGTGSTESEQTAHEETQAQGAGVTAADVTAAIAAGEAAAKAARETLEAVGRMAGMLEALTGRLDALDRKFEEKIATDDHKDMLFNKMYDELATYKKDLYAKLMSPFVNETISLLDDYERMVEGIDGMAPEKIVRYMRGIPGDLEDMLDNSGVERYEDDTEKFNPKTQRAIKTQLTGDKEADNRIAARLRKGYRWNGVMLKPEMVKIYKYKEGYVEPAPEPAPAQPSAQPAAEPAPAGAAAAPQPTVTPVAE